MAILSKGADPEALRAAANRLVGHADTLEQVRAEAGQAVSALRAAWAGRDLQHLLDCWGPASTALTTSAETVRRLGVRLRTNADAQAATSAGTGSTTGSTTGTTPGEPTRPHGGHPTSPPPAGTPGLGTTTDGSAIPDVPGERTGSGPQARSPWTPQGLAVLPDGRTLTTLYDHDDPRSGRLVVQAPDGTVLTTVPLQGLDHYGGIAVDGDRVYVTGNNLGLGPFELPGSWVQQYSLADLESGHPTPQSVTPIETGSTASFHDGHLYVAKFAEDGPGRVYAYPVDASGRVSSDPSGDWPAPTQVQGLAVDDGHFYFTQSFGRDNPSTLLQVDRATGQVLDTTELPNMAEGTALHHGALHTTYESGSNAYNHGGKDLEPRDHTTVTPVADGPR